MRNREPVRPAIDAWRVRTKVAVRAPDPDIDPHVSAMIRLAWFAYDHDLWDVEQTAFALTLCLLARDLFVLGDSPETPNPTDITILIS